MRKGRVPRPLKQLVHDLRMVMLPHTAQRMKERKKNSLKDFVDVAGILGVSHFLMLSATDTSSVRRCRANPPANRSRSHPSHQNERPHRLAPRLWHCRVCAS